MYNSKCIVLEYRRGLAAHGLRNPIPPSSLLLPLLRGATRVRGLHTAPQVPKCPFDPPARPVVCVRVVRRGSARHTPPSQPLALPEVHLPATPCPQTVALVPPSCRMREEPVSGNKAWLRRRLHAAIVRDYLEARADEGI